MVETEIMSAGRSYNDGEKEEKGDRYEDEVVVDDKLSHRIFSILESRFLFGYDDNELKHLWIPKPLFPNSPNSQLLAPPPTSATSVVPPLSTDPPPLSTDPPPPPPPLTTTSMSNNDNGNERGKVCILTIDGGGGMPSHLAAKALTYLENALKQKSGNTNASTSSYFDIAAGTGMGGILVSMLFTSSHCNTRNKRQPIIYSAHQTSKLIDDIVAATSEASSSLPCNNATSITAAVDASNTTSTTVPAASSVVKIEAEQSGVPLPCNDSSGTIRCSSRHNRSSIGWIRRRLQITRIPPILIPKGPLHLFECLHSGHRDRDKRISSKNKGKNKIGVPITSFRNDGDEFDGAVVETTTDCAQDSQEEEEEETKSPNETTVNCLDRKLKEILGEEVSLRDTLKPILIPCYDLRTSAPFLFSRTDAMESENYNFRMWEVCRATWAEPWRFKPTEMRSTDGVTRCVGVDGGLASMSNPTAAAITHVLHNKKEFPFVRGIEDLLVLSLATGGGPVLDEQQDSWARPIASIASQGTADLVDNAVSTSFAHTNSTKNYVRIQANVVGASSSSSSSIDDDILRQKTVESRGLLGGMKTVGERNNMEMLDWFADELILQNQTREHHRVSSSIAIQQLNQSHGSLQTTTRRP